MGEREHIFMYLFCITDSYASSGMVSFHSVVVLIHINVFECGECAIEFNFIERLSCAFQRSTWKQFHRVKKRQNFPQADGCLCFRRIILSTFLTQMYYDEAWRGSTKSH